MPKYKIGDLVWLATFSKHEMKTMPCSVCYGKLKVRVILGNDDEVVVDCDYCGHGFNPPTGTEQVFETVAKAEPFNITGMEINTCGNKEQIEYHMSLGCHSYRSAKENDLFATMEEALAKAEGLRLQDEKEEKEKTERIKRNVHKSFSWNAGYHMRQAKNAQKDFNYHTEKAQLCKSKSREKKGEE